MHPWAAFFSSAFGHEATRIMSIVANTSPAAPCGGSSSKASGTQERLSGTITSYDPENFSGVVEVDSGARYYISRRTGLVPASGWKPEILQHVFFIPSAQASDGRNGIAWLEKPQPSADGSEDSKADETTEDKVLLERAASRLAPYFDGRGSLLLTLAGYLVILVFVLYLIFG